MKPEEIVGAIFGTILAALLLLVVRGMEQSPFVTTTITSPTNGAIVSNTITISVMATSTVAPITHVVIYRDGVPIATNYTQYYLGPPGQLSLEKP